MTAAPTLEAAAGQAFDNLAARYAAGQLKTQVTIFCDTNNGLFAQATESSHPVSNWIAVLAVLATRLPTGTPPLADLTPVAQALYRLCWIAAFLRDSGGITGSQAATLLASYNTVIGFP